MTNHIYMLQAPGKFKFEHQMLSPPESGYATLQYLYCGICGGDYACYLGRRGEYPMTLGHEFVAKVICARTGSKFSPGDLVVSDLNFRCGRCCFCQEGRSHLCIHHADGYFSNRGFAQYGNLLESYLYPIPAIDWLPRTCFIEPLSCVIHACEMFFIHPLSRILIVGGGSIGSMFAYYLTVQCHCTKIFVLEKVKERAARLQNCFGVQSPSANAGPYDLVIDCSNEPEGTLLALRSTGTGGQICIMSHLYGLETSFIYETICKNELRAYFPLRNGETKNMHRAILCVTTYWESEYDNLIQVYSSAELNLAFQEKPHFSRNKQVIKMCD